MKKFVIFLFVCSINHFSFAQFKSNSIGVCYLHNETSDSIILEIAIPINELNKEVSYPQDTASFSYSGQIILFDANGEVYKTLVGKSKFSMAFWCNNDGGTQYRPTLYMQVKKSNLKRSLKGINALQDICCFVLLNESSERIPAPDFNVSTQIRLKGDYNKDGKIDCFIWTVEDDAHNCDGKPDNNLDIKLQIGEQSYDLRCCGP